MPQTQPASVEVWMQKFGMAQHAEQQRRGSGGRFVVRQVLRFESEILKLKGFLFN